MASKYRFSIIGQTGESLVESSASILKEAWNRERQLQLTRQLTINAEVRKRWLEAEPVATRNSEW